MKARFLLFTALAASLTLASCKKDDDEPTPPPAPAAPSQQSLGLPTLNGASGVLVASRNTLRSYFYSGSQITDSLDDEFETLIGHFYPSPGNYSTLSYAGIVSADDFYLTRSQNINQYSASLFDSTLNLIDVGTSVNWVVTGSSNHPAFSHTQAGFPDYVLNASFPQIINRSAGLTISHSVVNGAAYLLYYIANEDINGTVASSVISKVMPGTNTSISFTPQELAVLQPTNNDRIGFVLITSVGLDSTVVSSKKYYFSNQSGFTREVRIQ
jgi:hypothetical protein